MGEIFNPKYLNLPQQVQKNKNDIEDIKASIKTIYNTQQELTEETSSIDLTLTNIPADFKSGFLLSKNGLLFNIVTINNNTVYIEFYSYLKGEDGKDGQDGAEGPQGPRGLTGPQGPQGIQGVQGIQGIPGQTGPAGPQGIQGVKGDKGDNGNSFIVTGTVNTVDDLPPASSTTEGTSYFVGTTYPRNVYTVVNYQGSKIWQNQGTLQGPIGPQGPQGPTGATGQAGPQGEQGVQGPQGIQGPEGTPGTGFNFMGTWVSENEYYENDVVTYSTNNLKSSYVCISESISGSTTPPPQDTTNWQLFTEGTQGPQGEQGEQGPIGPQGEPGPTGGTLIASKIQVESITATTDNIPKELQLSGLTTLNTLTLTSNINFKVGKYYVIVVSIKSSFGSNYNTYLYFSGVYNNNIGQKVPFIGIDANNINGCSLALFRKSLMGYDIMCSRNISSGWVATGYYIDVYEY